VRAEEEAAEPGSPVKRAQSSWRMAIMRTIEDCYACIVEYEDLRWVDDREASPNDKAEMRSLMHTLADRVFSAFTAGTAGGNAATVAAISDDVLVTVARIAKGRRLLGRMVTLLEGTRKDEFLTAVLRNLAKIVDDIHKSAPASDDEKAQEEARLAEYVICGCADLDLSSVRTQLVNALQLCREQSGELVSVRAGCAVVTALVERGMHCISIGSSGQGSRSQWQGTIKDLLMFVTMYVMPISKVGEVGSGGTLQGAGSQLVKAVIQAYKPHMSADQEAELAQCFSAQGLDPAQLM